jgi:glyoxylase I family protein
VRGIHHSAIVTTDVELSKRFWRDGLGFAELMDDVFTGDWPTLFGAKTDQLRSVFLADPDNPESGIVELVVFDDPQEAAPPPEGPRVGFFLLSLNRDVDEALAALAEQGFTDGVRRISMAVPGSTLSLPMAVITAPDGVMVELIGSPR